MQQRTSHSNVKRTELPHEFMTVFFLLHLTLCFSFLYTSSLFIRFHCYYHHPIFYDIAHTHENYVIKKILYQSDSRISVFLIVDLHKRIIISQNAVQSVLPNSSCLTHFIRIWRRRPCKSLAFILTMKVA